MRHVHPQGSVDLVSNVPEGLEVEVTRVRGPAGDDDAGTLSESRFTNLFRLDAHRLAVYLVSDRLVVLTREVQAHAVSEVASVSQRQAEDRIANVSHRHEGCSICLST